MYEEFFQLNTLPFSLAPHPNFFCQLKNYQEILTNLQFHLKNGEGYISILGEPGGGKTLLCRKLIESLDESYHTVYLSKPPANPNELTKNIASKFGLDSGYWYDQNNHVALIQKHLTALHESGRKIVLFIDEAQMFNHETFQIIRALTNFENDTNLQVILFGQPELNKLHYVIQHINSTYTLTAMNKNDLDIYLRHRLIAAGYTNQPSLFTKRATKLLFKASGGNPRIVNVISHKALLVAFGRGKEKVDYKIMRLAINDTETAKKSKFKILFKIVFYIAIIPLLFLLIVYLIGNIPLWG